MIEVVNDDISSVVCEVLVNASNGRGYCGGKACVRKLHKGVAESLQFTTKGLIEVESKRVVRENGFFSRLFGFRAGSFFTTSSCGLPCKVVFHSVTMRNPASRSSLNIVRKCLLDLKRFCIGCGNGAVKISDFERTVNEIFFEDFWNIKLVKKSK